MDLPFRIEVRESFRVVGYAVQTTNQKKEGQKVIQEQWEKVKKNDLSKNLLPLMNQEPFGLLGISVYNIDKEDARKFRYFIGVSADTGIGEGMEAYIVPAMTWAVFPCTTDTIGKTEALAITKWLPRSDYRPLNSGYLTGRMRSGAPDLEVYGDNGNAQVWVAVRKK